MTRFAAEGWKPTILSYSTEEKWCGYRFSLVKVVNIRRKSQVVGGVGSERTRNRHWRKSSITITNLKEENCQFYT